MTGCILGGLLVADLVQTQASQVRLEQLLDAVLIPLPSFELAFGLDEGQECLTGGGEEQP